MLKSARNVCCYLLATGLSISFIEVLASHTLAQDTSAPPIIVYPNRTAAPSAAAEALLARTQERGRLRMIVGIREQLLNEDGLAAQQVEAQRARLRASQQSLLADLGTSQQESDSVALFDTIPFLAMNADAATLQRLLDNPQVKSIQEDVPVPPALPQSVPPIRADQAAALGFPGTGQVVAVLDTGVDKTHPMLAGKVVSEACYSSTVPGQATSLCPGGASSSTAKGSGVNCSTSISGCEHGTHVASIAVGKSAHIQGVAIAGVARGAKLIPIQVFSQFDNPADCAPETAPCIRSFPSDQIRGLERVYALRIRAAQSDQAPPLHRRQFNIASANLSLGGGQSSSDCDSDLPAYKAIVDNLRAAKIATAIAAGNDGFDGSVSFPACISTVVTVGSTTKTDEVSSFSNHASLVELMAPGSFILAAVPGGDLETLSGTSMATPHVAGAWAILKQAKPTASVSEVLEALACTGVPVSRAGITKPRIDVLAALDVLRSPAPGCN